MTIVGGIIIAIGAIIIAAATAVCIWISPDIDEFFKIDSGDR